MSEKIPLVMLPAFMTTATLWRHQIEALADIAEIQVVDLTHHDSIEGMANAVLDAAPERFALAGCRSAASRPSRSCGEHRSASPS